ncbi:MAG: RDD family protein [Pseudobdellovibrionaceae bacterium]
MVLPDFPTQFPEDFESDLSPELRPAKMADRFLGTIFDCVLMFPFFYVLLSPLLQEMMKVQIFGTDPKETFFYFGLAVGEVLILGILYQAVCWAYFGGTLGEKILKIEVQTQKGNRPSFFIALLRSLVWWGQVFLFGIPFLEVVAHPKRLGFHDRISETWVATQKKGNYENPGEPERNLVHTIYRFSFAVFIFWSAVLFWYLLDSMGDRKWTEATLEEKEQLCAKVSENLGSREKIQFADRIERALSLYAAKRIDEVCLKKEAEYSIWKRESAEAYLALSFAFQDDSQKSDLYHTKVCEIDSSSEACSVARLMNEEAEDTWDSTPKDAKDYKKLWALPFLIRDEKFKKAQELIESLIQDVAFASYLAEKRMSISLLLGDNEKARGIFLGSQGFLDLKVQFEMLSDLCARLRQKNCTGASKGEEISCSWLKDLAFQLGEDSATKIKNIVDRPVSCLSRMPADENSQREAE